MTDLSPVVGEAQASPKLTDVERAAMGTDLHVIACDTPLGQCVECMTALRTIRRIIVAVTPVIEERLEQSLPLADGLEGQERSEEKRCPNCAPGYDCERGIYEPVSSTGEETDRG